MAEGGWSYREAGGIARSAIWLLYANAAASITAIAFAWVRDFDPLAIGLGEGVFLLAELVLIIATAIFFFIWIYRANANARALGADDMSATPGWAVGWFFVPFANLVMPFMTVRELWKASVRPRDWQLVPAPVAIPLWWAFWLASNITGAIAATIGLQTMSEPVPTADTLAALSELLSIPAALLLAWIIGGIQAHQAGPEHLADRFA
ncbi:MAG TPA: DUF4328 domain-containing protein [Allosphingosinicella sp.]|nr:DUF4328 domain-containing protein [Allosphingosinicella sp.]